jgi:hypothetical protein
LPSAVLSYEVLDVWHVRIARVGVLGSEDVL